MIRRGTLPLLVSGLLALAGCGRNDDRRPGAGSDTPWNSAWERDSLRARLARSESQWNAQRPRRYAVHVWNRCACTPFPAKSFVITVDGDRIVAVRDSAGRALSPAGGRGYDVKGLFATVDSLIQRADSLSLHFEYDTRLGYPRRLYATTGTSEPDVELDVGIAPDTSAVPDERAMTKAIRNRSAGTAP